MNEPQPRLSYYKPNKTNTGAAIQFDLNAQKQSIFLEAASQSGEQSFDWGKKIIAKLDVVDIGKLLAVLVGASKFSKIFHDPSKREGYTGSTLNTTIELTKGVQYGYFLKISQQSSDKSVKSISLGLSDDEAQVLRVLLERAIERIYGW